MKNKLFFYLLAAAACLSAGCASKVKVERIGVDEKIDLSGGWNDYDAMSVAKEMVEDSLKASWLNQFNESNKRNPRVIIGHVANQSDEHINSDVFVKYLEREVMNSGRVIFVASSDERQQVRAEREDQKAGYTDPETIKAHGKERGADFMLIGSVNSVKDQVKGKSVVYYQVNMELVNLETNEKVWIGRKEIKKFIKVSKYSL